MIEEKLSPQAMEAEQGVLGAMILFSEALHKGIEKLNSDMFYNPKHQKIFLAIKRLYDSSTAVDLITVPDELERHKQLEDIERRYLLELVDGEASAAHIDDHIRLIIDAAMRRKLINESYNTISRCYDTAVPTGELIDIAERNMFDIAQSSLKGESKSLGQIMPGTMKKIEERGKMEESMTGLPSGFIEVDDKTSGFQRSELTIIAGRPSMGKTSFALNIAEHIAINERLPLVFFSLEMSEEQLAQRLLSSRARIPSQHLRSGYLTDDQWQRMELAAGELSDASFQIDDAAGITVSQIKAKARRLKLRNDIQCVIVDYLQLIRGQSRAENRQQEIAYISQSLKELAKDLKVPVIALSQLSRQVELRGKDARPQLSDLRESGAIEQDADVIIFVHRPRDEKGVLGDKAKIIIGKQRNGPTGIVELTFCGDYTRFEQGCNAGNDAQPVECVA